jgi:hypothetical protein
MKFLIPTQVGEEREREREGGYYNIIILYKYRNNEDNIERFNSKMGFL